MTNTLLTDTRRVRTLRLHAQDEGLVRCGAILLEDALRTAALPGAEGRRFVLVRRLNVGTIRSRESPARVALNIEDRMRNCVAQAVHAEEAGAAEHNIVYFHDLAEAVACLARRVARHEDTSAWFWPLAVPAWRAKLPKDEAMRVLVGATLELPVGIVAVAALLNGMHSIGELDTMLRALRGNDGAALLYGCGWSRLMPGIGVRAERHPEESSDDLLPATWRAALERWVKAWGGDDARSKWLAGMALVATNPARLVDPGLAERASALACAAFAHAADDAGMPQLQAGAVERVQPSGPGKGPAQETGVVQSPWDASPSSVSDGPAGRVRLTEPEAGLSESVNRRETDDSITGDVQAATNGMSPSQEPTREPLLEPTRDSLPGLHEPSHARERRELACEPVREPAAPSLPNAASVPGNGLPWGAVSCASQWAGLFLLLPLLERLGIATQLASQPELAEAGLHQRILRHAGLRCGATANDPVIELLDVPGGDRAISSFMTPPGWLAGLGLAGSLVLRRVAGQPGARVLADRSGRLFLALWHGMTPAQVRAFILESGAGTKAGMARGKPVAASRDLDLLVQAWELAVRRWLWRYSGMRLSELICRPGRIVLTPTCLDVYYDHQHADVRARKSGLDLDPGWLPWFGRIVQFHYVILCA